MGKALALSAAGGIHDSSPSPSPTRAASPEVATASSGGGRGPGDREQLDTRSSKLLKRDEEGGGSGTKGSLRKGRNVVLR